MHNMFEGLRKKFSDVIKGFVKKEEEAAEHNAELAKPVETVVLAQNEPEKRQEAPVQAPKEEKKEPLKVQQAPSRERKEEVRAEQPRHQKPQEKKPVEKPKIAVRLKVAEK